MKYVSRSSSRFLAIHGALGLVEFSGSSVWKLSPWGCISLQSIPELHFSQASDTHLAEHTLRTRGIQFSKVIKCTYLLSQYRGGPFASWSLDLPPSPSSGLLGGSCHFQGDISGQRGQEGVGAWFHMYRPVTMTANWVLTLLCPSPPSQVSGDQEAKERTWSAIPFPLVAPYNDVCGLKENALQKTECCFGAQISYNQ